MDINLQIKKLYRSGEAANAAGITRAVLNQWIKRRLIQPTTIAPGMGSGAFWNLISILQLRLIKVLVEHGWTRAAAGWMASHKETEDLIIFSVGQIINSAKAPGRLFLARDGEAIAVAWYHSAAARELQIGRFEVLPAYTSVDFAEVMNFVTLRLD